MRHRIVITIAIALLPCLAVAGIPRPPGSEQGARSGPAVRALAGADTLRVENLEGALLVRAGVSHADRSAETLLLLDTGAGCLALDRRLARALKLRLSPTRDAAIDVAEGRPRLRLAARLAGEASPVLAVDLAAMREVTDRPLRGLLGQSVFEGCALLIDYQRERVVIARVRASGASPAERVADSRAELAAWLAPEARAVPFELLGDGKIVLRGGLAGSADTLSWILDTGATKCVLFPAAREAAGDSSQAWPTLAGLSAPTISGEAETRMLRVPEVRLAGLDGPIATRELDAGLMDGALRRSLELAIGRRLAGLVGASFLRRYLVVIDYPHRVLWLEPRAVPRDQRKWEYCTIGLQLERRAGRTRVSTVAEGSPGAAAGIRRGDEVLSVDGRDAARLDLARAVRLLEGPPGSVVRVRLLRGHHVRSLALLRRQLL